MSVTATAMINLSALTHNLKQIRRLAPNQKVLAMIKANAYGHGIVQAAEVLQDADAFGVANLSEVFTLRKAGIAKDLVVMRGFLNLSEMNAFIEDPHLIACVHDQNQIELLAATQMNGRDKVRVWMNIDTGMHRLGLDDECARAAYAQLSKLACVSKPMGVYSHLADSDNPNKTFTLSQLKSFFESIDYMPSEKSVLNSAGIIAYPEVKYDWVRPGIVLYGASPFADRKLHHEKITHFQAAMTLHAKIIAIKAIKKGESIGYCCAFTAPQDMTVCVIGIGYGDGYPRHAKTGTPVLINGKRCPLVGRVSMDMISVDISHLTEVMIGDNVTLWGEDLPIEEIAQCADTIPNELLCHVTQRVNRVYQ